MGRESEIKTGLMGSIISYAREKHKDDIDRAYEYFWDEQYPGDFLAGTALELGFVNFEDWFVFDYKVNDNKELFIDLYIRNHKELTDDELNVLNKIKDSMLSLYEVVSVSRDKRVILRDLLQDGEYDMKDKILSKGINREDIFATRLLHLDGKYVMSGCVFPFATGQKKKVLDYVTRQFKRYIKNENPEGTKKSYLKAYGDIFNLVWMNCIQKPDEHGK